MVWRRPFPLNGRSLSTEGEVHPSEIPKVILCSNVARAVYAESGVQLVHFDGTQLDGLGQGEVQSATELHRGRIAVAADVHPGVNGGTNPMTSNRKRPKLAVHETHLVCQLPAENASGRVEDDQRLDYSKSASDGLLPCIAGSCNAETR